MTICTTDTGHILDHSSRHPIPAGRPSSYLAAMQAGSVLGPIMPEDPPIPPTHASRQPWPSAYPQSEHALHPHRVPYHPEGSASQRRMDDLSSKGQLFLTVCQQPERARLCSYKEENDTMDRRPVDPPPVIELKASEGDMSELLDSVSFFIRASLVQADPQDNVYPAIKMPGGIEATAGEIIQTPEKLKHIDGKTAVLCIFAKLSVRLPGVFRLKFTLYEAADQGVVEITHTISEPFEVFSPKLFKGMHESTLLTRHLAAQGLKVKLRTDSTGGKQSRRRSQASTPLSKPPPSFSSRPPAPMHPHDDLSDPYRPPPPDMRMPVPHSSLVWRPQYNASFPDHAEPSDRRPPLPDGVDGARKIRRLGRDDGFFPSFMDMSGRIGLSLPGTANDLSAFALNQSRTPDSASRSVSHSSSSGKGKERQSSYPEPSSSSSSHPQAGKRYRDTTPVPTYYENKLGLGPGDDGIPKLPSLSSLALSVPSGGRAPTQPMQPQTFVLPRLSNLIAPPHDSSSDSPGGGPSAAPGGRPFLPPLNLPPRDPSDVRDVDGSRRSPLPLPKKERP